LKNRRNETTEILLNCENYLLNNKMAKIVFEGKEGEINDGEPIREVSESLGVPFGCRNGLCSCCKVKINKGEENLCELTQKEKDMGLETKEKRLACQASITSGTVEFESISYQI
jgi:ferredoxin